MKIRKEEGEKKMRRDILNLVILTILSAIGFWGPDSALAHCDGLDGPVVTAAKQALESDDVNLILIWVQKKDEGEIKKAFQKTVAVRKLTPEAKELADLYFFETLVRVHRAGEGAPYTGLRAAGRDLGPAIPGADKAVADGKLEPLFKLLTGKIHDGLHEQFKQVLSKKKFKKDDVEAGRRFVGAYVSFVHYVERLYDATKEAPHGDHAEHEAGEGHKH
jgi:hypothetical protein